MRKRYEVEEEPVDSNILTSKSDSKNKNSIHSVHFAIGVLFSVFLFLLFGAVYYIDGILPTPLKVVDEIKHPDAFITERAHHDLKLLTDLGPKVVGSYENEVLAVDFLKRELNFIVQQSNKNQKIELDFQLVTGAHYLKYVKGGIIDSYAKVQNVVAKLHGKSNTSDSLLINTHFDSVPTSPGGSDDGINVVTVLEILRKLSRNSEKLLHNVIFLFNGAEETPLQAAHGFITQHKWAKDCKVVINLEACGSGGKIILFQTGPSRPWLMKYYRKVPHPYGQVAGEEIFQSNLIPSDTDFRIFRDHGHVVGFDMAFFKNGYVYHTKYDSFSRIPLGSFQHVGDNTLSLVKSIANAPELSRDNPHGKSIYFDIFGLVFISYTETVGAVINYIIVLVSTLMFITALRDFGLGFNKHALKFIIYTFAALIAGWIFSALFVFLTAFTLDSLKFSMSWYTHTWIIFGLYVIPTVAVCCAILLLVNDGKLSISVQTQLQCHVVRLIWTLVLLIGTAFKIRAMYAIAVPIMINSIIFGVIHSFRNHHTVRSWQIIYITGLIFPTAMLMYQTLTTVSLFIPITGRFGNDKNSDAIIGLMCTMFTILITSPFVPLVNLVRNPKVLLSVFGGFFVAALIVAITPIGFPYGANSGHPTPQRHWILHSSRIIHGENNTIVTKDSGYFMLNMDRNSPRAVKSYVPEIERSRDIMDDCKKYLLCGFPLAHGKMTLILEHSTWVPASQPVIHEPIGLTYNKTKLSASKVKYTVTASGPDRLVFYLSPFEGIKVTNISLLDFMPGDAAQWNGRDFYFVLHVSGIQVAPLSFSFEVESNEDVTEGKSLVEVAVNGIYVHDNKMVKTPHYQKFLNSFPDWADVTAWLGAYESWII